MFENAEFNIERIMLIKSGEAADGIAYPHNVSYSGNILVNELFIYLCGEADFNIGGKKMHLSKNGIVSLPKGKYSRYDVTVHKPVSYIDIMYLSDAVPSDGIEMLPKVSDYTSSLFEKANKLWTRKKSGYYSKTMSVVYEIINSIQNRSGEYASSDSFRALSPSEEYLYSNYLSREFDYEIMAELSGFSYSHFKKLFIKKYGCSPIKQVTDMKMKYAKELLCVGKYTVSEIAEMCGFESACYFSLCFKKIHGVSPKAYEKTVLEERK